MSQTGQKTNKVLVEDPFTQTHLAVLNTKNCVSKLSIKMFIKKIRAGKAYAYRMTSVTYNFFNFTPDNCVRCEAAFVGHNSIFAGNHPMSGANIQDCLFITYDKSIF